jgi:NAD(P)-dependent dehydrogenase (short-subunit alcohol dehydrogenase family)
MSNANWNFAGKTAFVSGGASGIGKANVRKLAAAGACVVFTDVNEEGGRALERELRESGADARFFVCDAADGGAVKAVTDSAFAISGRLDIAINNVGRGARGHRVHEVALEEWLNTLNGNLTTTFTAMQAQIERMLESGGGAIVNIASMAGVRWSETAGVSYAVAKAGVIRLTEFAAITYAGQNIRINVVCPGVTATEAVLKFLPDPAARTALAKRSHPMGRLIEPDEIADACLWACSDAASGVTGLMIPVDGGWAAN